jgi:hypothetical protein
MKGCDVQLFYYLTSAALSSGKARDQTNISMHLTQTIVLDNNIIV